MPHPADDDLALLALGEPVPAVEQHVRGCGTCSAELLALRSTVETARGADLAVLAPPPSQVWQRITDELGLPDQLGLPDELSRSEPGRSSELGLPHKLGRSEPGRSSEREGSSAASEPASVLSRPPAARRTPWRRPLAAAAVLAAAAAAAGVLVAALGEPAAPPSVPLVPLGQLQASGEVVLTDLAAGRTLLVDTAGLPDADGSYEVWLLDPDEGRLVALGVLDDGGRGRLAVPEEVRVSEYPTVDVSLEPHDGDPGHSGDSVLRADLPERLP